MASLLSVLAIGIGLIVTNTYNRQQQQLALQGQITDRFAKAVEQLGEPGPQKVDVRLGAIYALQRIMRDSADDQPAVVAILSAFVRVHAPRLSDPDGAIPHFMDPPPVDIQAALTVIARRDPSHDQDGHVDLSGANLGRAVLPGAKLRNADLSGAYLRGVNLSGADLNGADLAETNLTSANLAEADLSRADLHRAGLDEANLNSANLHEANLRFADFHLSFANEVCPCHPTLSRTEFCH